MKKRTRDEIIGILSIGLAAAAVVPAMASFDSASMDKHRIGVLVYDIADDEVVSFRNYLENYIGTIFPDVQFIYSESIFSEEEELAFIQNVSDAGAEGILSFLDYNLEAEVEACARNEVYYLMASSTVPEESFEAVKDNPYFLGVIGPGSETEYEAGYEMGKFFSERGSDEYFIFSGGSGMGNEMHLLRTEGMLDALEEAYGAEFEKPVSELALTGETAEASVGDAKVCIFPGYLIGETAEQAARAYQDHPYANILSAQTLYSVKNAIQGAEAVGEVDCFSETNLQGFTKSNLTYLAGKYASIIGPSFAAMYNAVTGYADEFRKDGEAFKLHQGFWISSTPEDYIEKYTFSSSIEMNAYNYQDLMQVCRVYNLEATLEQLEELAENYTFEDAKERRGTS